MAGDLRTGDELLLQSGKIVAITEMEWVYLESPVKVYNFEVENWHTYFVSELDVLVHNKAMKRISSDIEGAVTDETLKWLDEGSADNTVYYGLKDGEAVYTGITKQDLGKRLSQHNYGLNGKSLNYLEAQYSSLTRNQARAIEQYLIENGPANAMNRIASIGSSNPHYSGALLWAERFIKGK